MTNYTYAELLKMPQWTSVRNKILCRDAYSCLSCGAKTKLQVHHRQYHISKKTQQLKMPWEYHPNYLLTLCAYCHKNGHAHFTIPTFIINH